MTEDFRQRFYWSEIRPDPKQEVWPIRSSGLRVDSLGRIVIDEEAQGSTFMNAKRPDEIWAFQERF
jgi:hypothetical protein